ncbi:hypothetical protein HOY34_21205 [Xinfangfangia sp. D13-10-4-6]|uniref:hypothetical protein n=1 Tax=Pseudogemmobacter hezensis TaxID=2737662 RepID=UPI001555BCC9|nr:hypothetical protein [Pseudogemmobacter hezensis]NPD17700.1 hypothetical protein [Pseudogemmobacter hezensis]
MAQFSVKIMPLNGSVLGEKQHMGAHYYTVLNFTGPALQVSGATLAASWLGLAWVRAHDRHGRADIFR